MKKIEVYSRESGTRLHRGWDRELYLSSATIPCGIMDVAEFNGSVYVGGHKLDLPDDLRKELLKGAGPLIRVVSA